MFQICLLISALIAAAQTSQATERRLVIDAVLEDGSQFQIYAILGNDRVSLETNGQSASLPFGNPYHGSWMQKTKEIIGLDSDWKTQRFKYNYIESLYAAGREIMKSNESSLHFSKADLSELRACQKEMMKLKLDADSLTGPVNASKLLEKEKCYYRQFSRHSVAWIAQLAFLPKAQRKSHQIFVGLNELHRYPGKLSDRRTSFIGFVDRALRPKTR